MCIFTCQADQVLAIFVSEGEIIKADLVSLIMVCCCVRLVDEIAGCGGQQVNVPAGQIPHLGQSFKQYLSSLLCT